MAEEIRIEKARNGWIVSGGDDIYVHRSRKKAAEEVSRLLAQKDTDKRAGFRPRNRPQSLGNNTKRVRRHP